MTSPNDPSQFETPQFETAQFETARFETLRIEHAPGDAVASLVLDRPERLNALSRVLLTELVDACGHIDRNPDIKVVVVRGAGSSFSAGFDLGDFAKPRSDSGSGPGTDDVSMRDVADLGRLAADALADIGPLTIAAVRGHCVGGGLVLVAACDLRLAADDTRFAIPEVDLGIPLAWGGIPRLVRELGPAVTKELVLTCRPFDAAEAHALRFVNRVVPVDQLDDAADTLARELAGKPRFSLRTTKQQVNAVTDDMASTRRNANDADTLVVAMTDPESRAAARRYLERRASRSAPD